MVIGASVHPQPPYQDLQVVCFLHSVQFFGSILTSLHTNGHRQVAGGHTRQALRGFFNVGACLPRQFK